MDLDRHSSQTWLFHKTLSEGLYLTLADVAGNMVGLSRDPRTMPQAGKLRAVIDDIDHDFEQAVRSFFCVYICSSFLNKDHSICDVSALFLDFGF